MPEAVNDHTCSQNFKTCHNFWLFHFAWNQKGYMVILSEEGVTSFGVAYLYSNFKKSELSLNMQREKYKKY